MSVPYGSLMRYLFPALLLHGECGEPGGSSGGNGARLVLSSCAAGPAEGKERSHAELARFASGANKTSEQRGVVKPCLCPARLGTLRACGFGTERLDGQLAQRWALPEGPTCRTMPHLRPRRRLVAGR